MALFPDLDLRGAHLLITKTLVTVYDIDLASNSSSEESVRQQRSCRCVHTVSKIMIDRNPTSSVEKCAGFFRSRRRTSFGGVAELRPHSYLASSLWFAFACFQHSDSLLDVRQSNRKRETFTFVTLDGKFAAMFPHNAAHN